MEPMRQTVTNDAASASVVRSRLRDWLDDAGWPRAEADDLVIAVSEAVSNSIEHAYPGPRGSGLIIVRADEEGPLDKDRRIVVTVSDHGRWRPAPDDPGYRGRGIAVMRAVTDGVHIDRGTTGTTVRLFGRPVPVDDITRSTPATH